MLGIIVCWITIIVIIIITSYLDLNTGGKIYTCVTIKYTLQFPTKYQSRGPSPVCALILGATLWFNESYKSISN